MVIAVIPARYASTRFPAKALALLKGKPVIQWVWEKVRQSKKIQKIIVATDDSRIADVVKEFGGEVKMTSSDHPSGTDRVAEVVQNLQADWIVNIQGDEPMIEGRALDDFIEKFPSTEGMATLARKFETPEEASNLNMIKVVTDVQGNALYFSRHPIPYNRDQDADMTYWHHLGIYAYRPETLQKIVSLPPSKLEQIEKLEQLRALENGIAIRVIPTNLKPIGIDTPEDLQRVEKLIK